MKMWPGRNNQSRLKLDQVDQSKLPCTLTFSNEKGMKNSSKSLITLFPTQETADTTQEEWGVVNTEFSQGRAKHKRRTEDSGESTP